MNELEKTEGTLTPSEAFPFEKEIIGWEHDSAVERVGALGNIVKANGCDLARELFIAHEALARRGGDRRSEEAARYSFTDFLNEAKISRKTAYFYLKCYDPVENRLLDPEEVKPSAAGREGVTPYSEARVVRAMETGERAEGWTVNDEHEYKIRAYNRKCADLTRKWLKGKVITNYKNKRDYFAEVLEASNARQYSKVSLPRKEQAIAQAEVFEHVADFLRMIEDPAVRLAAAFNTGLKIRQIINELAESEAEFAQYDISDAMER